MTHALSTSIEFSFFNHSAAHLTASQSQRADCLPNEAESLNLFNKTILSSRENPLWKRLFKEVAASHAVISPSFVNSCINSFAFQKSLPVQSAMLLSQTRAFSNFTASLTDHLIPAVIQ